LKLSSFKKIIRNRFLKDYNKSLIFEDEIGIPYSNDMEVEMFCGSFQVPVKNYKTIGDYKKKMCMMYSLGKVYTQDIILEYCPEELWIYANYNGSLVTVELKRFEYEIMKGEYYHNFNAMICNAWNYLALRRYIALLIGEENRLMEIYEDDNLWIEEDLEVNVTRVKIEGLIRKRDNLNRFVKI
jgi:hypothetical protein